MKYLKHSSTLTNSREGAIRHKMRMRNFELMPIGPLLVLPLLGACVTLEAPDKPIVINLNINIKQEVVYRLDKDAKELINQEADIF